MNYSDLDKRSRAALRDGFAVDRQAFYDAANAKTLRATLIFGDPSDAPAFEPYPCRAGDLCYYKQAWPVDTEFHDHTGGSLDHRCVAVLDFERFWDKSRAQWALAPATF